MLNDGVQGPSAYTLICFYPVSSLILLPGWPPTTHAKPVFLPSGMLRAEGRPQAGDLRRPGPGRERPPRCMIMSGLGLRPAALSSEMASMFTG